MNEIDRAIIAADPAFKNVVKAAGPSPRRRPAPVAERFPAVVRSITFQLLATRAADTIHARVLDVLGEEVTPETVLSTSVETLRSAGLNETKARAMRELAERTLSGDIDFRRHGRRGDADVTSELTQVRGVGPWTTHMYLMFTLARPDVWPVGDYGVRMGWSLIHGLDETISPRELANAGDHLIGHRSVVSWYCWQAVHIARSLA